LLQRESLRRGQGGICSFAHTHAACQSASASERRVHLVLVFAQRWGGTSCDTPRTNAHEPFTIIPSGVMLRPFFKRGVRAGVWNAQLVASLDIPGREHEHKIPYGNVCAIGEAAVIEE
jgi:hypothetical protein